MLYTTATFQRSDGLTLADRQQIGILVASAAVIASNTYVLMNTYRWDWLTVLINVISSLLLYFWTGVYTSTTTSAQFYNHGAEVYGSLSYWTVLFVTVVLCLLPRFAIKAFQKVFFPYDVDIIREQVTQGKFAGIQKNDKAFDPSRVDAGGSPAGSDVSAVSSVVKPIEPQVSRDPRVLEDERPIYPPSMAPTTTTHNPRSQNGSNGTTFTADSFDFGIKQPPVNSWEHQSEAGLTIHYAQKRSSVTSNDFPNGHPLLRIESSSGKPQTPHSPLRTPHDIHAV
jgi:phospholipid-translocating ATPase